MGLKNRWRPKCCFKTWVYHEVWGQRRTLIDINEDHRKNLRGLINQYGAYGLKELADIYDSDMFRGFYNEMLGQIDSEE